MFLKVQPHQFPIVLSSEVIKSDDYRVGGGIPTRSTTGTHWVSLSFSEEEQDGYPTGILKSGN